MSSRSPLFTLLDETVNHLTGLDLAPDLTDLRDAFVLDLKSADTETPASLAGESARVRGLKHAALVLDRPPAKGLRALDAAARDAFGHVRWSEFYAPDDWSSNFLEAFANGEGIGPDGRIRSDRVILGLFVLGPDTLYPPHAHPAEEFYISLSGDPRFQIGADSDFEPLRDGEVAWHQSNVSHAIQTGAQPFFAVFGWRGRIAEKSWYREDMRDEQSRIRHPTIAK